MNILQEKWRNGQILGLDLIMHHDQVQMIDISCKTNLNFPQTFHQEYQLHYAEKLSLTQLLKDKDDLWNAFQINDQLELDGGFILCGEGEMGNEGFIAKTDKNNMLIWMLFSSSSNPFVRIVQDHDLLYIQSSHQFYVVLNIKNMEIYISHASELNNE